MVWDFIPRKGKKSKPRKSGFKFWVCIKNNACMRIYQKSVDSTIFYLKKTLTVEALLQSAESEIPLKILADWITQLDKLDISAELTSTRYGMTFLNFNSGRIRVPRWQNSLQIARVPRKTTKTKFTLFKMWLSNINISEVLDMLTSGWTGFRHSTVSWFLNWLQALRGSQILDQFVESRQSHVSYCLHNRQCKQ